ncbi:hypothetical protein ACLMJK_002743 [Lecanora helva]
MAGYAGGSNFSQREFQIPIEDADMDSPTHSFTGSQTSSNEASQNQLRQGQFGGPASMHSQSSSRGFSFSNMLPSRVKKTNEPPKLPVPVQILADKVEKVPKRRGPKPDSKPAQNRRQELNRAAQRTHRERKELYLKDLEMRLNQAQAAMEEITMQKDQAIEENKVLKAQAKACENENRQLKQLLRANNIPLIRAPGLNAQHNTTTKVMSVPMTTPQNNSYIPKNGVSGGYEDPAFSYKNASMSSTYPNGTATTSYPPTMPGVATTTDTAIFNSDAYSTAQMPTSSVATYTNSSQGLPQLENPNVLPVATSAQLDPLTNPTAAIYGQGQVSLHPAFKDPHDPRFVDFIIDLEATCQNHAGFLMERLADPNAEEPSGHALMLSTPPLKHIHQRAGDYQTQAPQMPMADLNQLLLKSVPFNRNGEVTPIGAAHMIMADPRFHLLSDEDFAMLQLNLKSKSRCYGFGAVLEDYEITDAMDQICAKYITDPTQQRFGF